MDNFGYQNWGAEDSYDSSPNKYGKFGSQKKTGKSTYTSESFDYDISSDFADSPPLEQRYKKPGSTGTESFGTNRFSTARNRTSVEERTKEILERNKAAAKDAKGDDGDRLKSYQDTYKELMEGIELNVDEEKPKPIEKKTEAKASKPTKSLSFSKFDSFDSPGGGDSFDISAADLEVGALAARRAREKANDRRRRMSLDKAPHTLDQSSFNSLREHSMYAKKGSESPDMGHRRSASDLGYGAGMQFSSALSSIQRSYGGEEGDRAGGEFAHFGSTGHSDDDIYQMLNVTGGTADSLKFGSAPASARNSAQGASMGGPARNRNTASGRRSGAVPEAQEDEGGMSDVTQGSRDEDDAGISNVRTTKPTHTASTAQSKNKPITSESAAISRVSSKNADSFYSVPDTEEDHSGAGSSGDSEKAQSPYSSYGHAGEQLKMATAGDGVKTADLSGHHGASADEEEEYSLDDFEQDPKSPEKPAPKQTEAKPTTAIFTTAAAPVGAPSTSKPPPAQLGLNSPAKATAAKALTPSNSAASLHSGAKSAGLNSVEEIMQRWYTADSDFMQRSLKRMGSGESGFTLDDEDMKPIPAAAPTTLAEGIPSQSTFATVTKTEDSSMGSATGAPISALAITNPSPFGRNSATPSPLTTAAPTPVATAAATGGATSGSVPIGFRSDSANSGVSGQGIARASSSNSDYSSDSMHQEPSSIGGVAPDMSPAPATTGFTAIASTSAPVVTAPTPISAPAVPPAIPATTTDSDRTVFDLSDSFPADNQQQAAAAAKPTVQVLSTFNTAARPGSVEPVQKTAAAAPEIPRLFAQRSDNASYMSLDQLPSFQDNTPISATPESNSTPSPRAEATAYPRELGAAAGNTAPGSASPAVSAASRYQQDASDDDQSLSSAPSGRDPLSYVMAGAEHDDTEMQRLSRKQGRQSLIAPPRVRTKSRDERPRSAPPRGGKTNDGLPPRKLSANTAAKIQQLKVLSPEERRQKRIVGTRPRHGVSASVAAPTALSTLRARTSRDSEVLAAQQKSTEAVQRLTQENWRLFRKYERLEFELQDLRSSQQSNRLDDTLQTATSAAAVPLSAPNTTKNASSKRPKRSPTGIVERIDRGDKNSKITKGEQGPVRRPGAPEGSDSRPSTPSKASFSRPYDIPSSDRDPRGYYEQGTEGWEVHMEEALQRLKDDNRKLLEREKAVRVREEAVSIREVTVDMREKLLKTGASTKTEEENKKEFFLREEVAILREREQALLRENDALKADRFMHSQDLAAIEDGKLRQSQGLDRDLNINGSYEPLAKKFAAQMHKNGVYGSSVLKPALKSYYTDKGKHPQKAKDHENAAEIEMIPVSREDYEKLVEDHAAQERLLDVFQNENNRLTKCLQDKDTEYQLRTAVFYDEREKLNKELNRYKNARRAAGMVDSNIDSIHSNNDREISPLPPPAADSGGRMSQYDDIPIQTSRKTAEILRMELEMDGTIRLLKEQLQVAEEGLGQRERDLQVTIEKLRKDNRELVGKLTHMQHLQQPQDHDYLQLQTDNNILTEEIQELKQRLEWYSQNQKLIDTADEDLLVQKQVIKVLKKELLLKGLEGQMIDKLIASIKAGNLPSDYNTTITDMNESLHNQSALSTGRNSNKMRTVNGRNYGDIKKIKELEGVIRDLQDSLRKRHPDSVANLIRAATVSDSVQAERREQEQQVHAMRQELDDMKVQHEKRLRSLRQEHERIKVQYEKAREELEQTKAAAGSSSTTGGGLGGLTKGSSSASNTVKTLSQALNKIRELEEELERCRAFYTKKVEDVQRKAEVQMRALKRGEDSSANAGTGFDQQIQLQVLKATAEYTEKIALLERELMDTAEELGRVKAAAIAASTEKQPNVSFIPRPGSISTPITAPHSRAGDRSEHGNEGAMLYRQQDLIRMTQHERDSLCASHEQRMEELKRNHDSYITQLQAQWTSEREGLQRRLKDEEERCTELRKELMDTVRSIAHAPPAAVNAAAREPTSYVIESKSPDMKQFQLMESQIAGLEVRMQRREKELMTAVEDAKSAAATERSRMEALHAQECREKDEQLVRFQHELVQLVAALRHWKLKNSNAVTVDSDTQNLPIFA